jgi:predicted Zn-dependent peptidase
MQQTIVHHRLPNGLTVVIERMPDVQSAALAFLVPMGVIHEDPGANGTSAALCDLITRGAGERDNRSLSTIFDNLGVQRTESVGWNFISLQAAMLAGNVDRVLPLYADVILRPQLPEDELPAVLLGVEHSLRAIEDDPQRRVIIELRKACYPPPWGRSSDGDLADLKNITLDRVRDLYRRGLRANDSILGIAGNVDPDPVLQQIESLFGEWKQGESGAIAPVQPKAGVFHLPADSTQTHIGIAYEAVPYGHADYYPAWAAVNILSGGSSSRLFTEVREKRGLCYSVYATLNSLRDHGSVLAYAGTTNDRAQETLDCCLREMQRIGSDIDAAELSRCKARAKSSLVMQQESTMARANSIARDWFHLGRIQTLDEIHQEIEAITVADVVDYVERHPARDFTILSVGGAPLRVENNAAV